MRKSLEAFRTISEVAAEIDVPKHVLRFWEGKFSQLKPMKRGGGRRYYRPEDVDLLKGIRQLLYGDGFTIKGVQKLLREHGVDFVKKRWREGELLISVQGSPNIPDIASEAARRAVETGAGLHKRSGFGHERKGCDEKGSPAPLSGLETLRRALKELEACKRILLQGMK